MHRRLADLRLVPVLLALVVVAAVTLLGTNINTVFTDIANEVGTWGPFGGP